MSGFTSLLHDPSRARFAFRGLVPYRDALELQTSAHALRLADAAPDEWMCMEHPLVITRGVRGTPGDVIANPGGDVEIFDVNRGGMTTLHNPGQLVLYPIVKLAAGSTGAGLFSRALLAMMRKWIRDEFGVDAEAPEGRPGLYHNGRKLMSIGISARGGVTMHGVALNMSGSTEDWRRIVACGDPDAQPVSLSKILDRETTPSDHALSLAEHTKLFFGYNDFS